MKLNNCSSNFSKYFIINIHKVNTYLINTEEFLRRILTIYVGILLLYLSLFYISWKNVLYTLYNYIIYYIVIYYYIISNRIKYVNQLWDNYLYKYFNMYWVLTIDIIGLKDLDFNNGYLVKNDPPITG